MPSVARSTRARPLPIPPRSASSRARTLWIRLLAVLLAGATAWAANPLIAHADVPSTAENQAPKPPPAVWGACPNNSREAAEHKLVRQFERGPGSAVAATMLGGVSELVCGNDGYGYYHIVNRHYVEWNGKSIRTSENWRDVADYAIAEALRSPQVVTFRASSNTFCYSREIYLINKVTGAIVDVFHPHVVLRASDGRIITAYTSREPCRG
jgi:hypothetical protein